MTTHLPGTNDLAVAPRAMRYESIFFRLWTKTERFGPQLRNDRGLWKRQWASAPFRSQCETDRGTSLADRIRELATCWDIGEKRFIEVSIGASGHSLLTSSFRIALRGAPPRLRLRDADRALLVCWSPHGATEDGLRLSDFWGTELARPEPGHPLEIPKEGRASQDRSGRA